MVSSATALVLARETRTVRLLSLVRPPVVSAPVIRSTSSLTDVIAAAPGAVVAIVNVAGLLILPAASISSME